MAGRFTRIVGEAGKAAYLINSRIAGYLLLGVLVNVALLALLRPELSYLASGGPQASGGSGATDLGLLASLRYQLSLVGIAGLFGVAFPIGYFLLGKSQGVRGAINALAARRTEVLVGHISHKLLQWARRRPDWQSRLEKGGLQQAIDQLGPTFFDQLPGVRRAIRVLIGVLRKRVPLANAVLETIKQTAGDEATSEQRLTEAARGTSIALREAVEKRFSPPGFVLPATVLAINVGILAAIKVAI